MTQPTVKLALAQRVEILTRLRETRALVLRDAEAFNAAVSSLEHVGQVLGGKVGTGFGDYEDAILDLITASGRNEREEVRRLFNVVREARNMAVHEGAWARHLSTRLVDLLLIVESAISQDMTSVGDLMVRGPVAAQTWHLVAHARRAMLENSFSCLPIYLDGGRWGLLTDVTLMRFLRAAQTTKESRALLSTSLGAALGAGQIKVAAALCCSPGTTVAELLPRMADLPVLVIEEHDGDERLLGIITAFDLL